MTLKESLVQYCDIKVEIKELEQKIERLEPKTHDIVSDSVDSTTKHFPIIRNHAKIIGLNQKAIKQLEHYKTILEDRYERLLEMQTELEEFIDALPTSRLRRIFEYRYIDQLTWQQVAQKIGNNASEESIRKEHDRFLEKNEVCPICPEKT